MSDFVLGYRSKDGSIESQHRDVMPWHEALLPRRFHRCRAQTRGCINYFTLVERCACGAISMGGAWMRKNERR